MQCAEKKDASCGKGRKRERVSAERQAKYAAAMAGNSRPKLNLLRTNNSAWPPPPNNSHPTMNFGAFSKATELKKRIWFTLGALIVYRLGHLCADSGDRSDNPAGSVQPDRRRYLGHVRHVRRWRVVADDDFALNIMPYISASIIMQLMTAVSPTLEAMKKEGETGRKKINQYTRYLTVLICILQAYGIAVGLEGMTSGGAVAVDRPGLVLPDDRCHYIDRRHHVLDVAG